MIVPEKEVTITNSKDVLRFSFEDWCLDHHLKPSQGDAVRRFTQEHFLGIIEDREVWKIPFNGEIIGAVIPRPAKISAILTSMEKKVMAVPESFRWFLHGNV